MECKCGCGQETEREYVWGHKTRHVRPTEKKNLCECGCGTPVTTRFVKGHIHRLNAIQKEVVECGCGCGQTTSPGCRFISGHNSKTLRELALRSERMERLWRESPEKFKGRTVWSKGETKQTDERLERHSSLMASSFTDEKRKHYRELGKESAKFLPHPTGSAHPNWKGGVSSIYQMVYGNRRLYEEWKFPVMKAAGFRCVSCGSAGPFNVHHDPIRLSKVVSDACGGVDVSAISFESRKDLCEKIVDWHLDPSRDIRGVCLCVDCHRLAHRHDPDVD